MKYKCLSCGNIVDENKRLWVLRNSEGKDVYKCPECRGELEKSEKENAQV